MSQETEANEDLQKDLPMFKTWRGVYFFVLGFLAVLIILFSFITSYYS